MAAPRIRLSDIDSDVAVCHCKLCGAPTVLDEYAGFLKSCVDPATTGTQANPLPIPYMHCSQRGRLFTNAFNHLSDGLHVAFHSQSPWLPIGPLV